MGGKETSSLQENAKCLNRMVELENHHFAATKVINDSGKNYQWLLKPPSERLWENGILTQSQSSSHRLFINYRGGNGTFEMDI